MREKRDVTHPPEKKSDPENSESQVELPNPDLNPMVNQTLGRNLGRWAQVYFTNAPENRDKAVGDLLRELEDEGGVVQRKGPRSEKFARQAEQPPDVELAEDQRQLVGRDETQATSSRDVVACPQCKYENSSAQSFCGMCGASLKVSHAEETASQRQQIPPDNVDWLREQPLAGFRASEDDVAEERGSGGRAVAVVVAVLIAIFAGFTWWSRSHQEVRSSAPQSVAVPAAPPAEANPVSSPKQGVAEKAADKEALKQLPADDKNAEVKSRSVASKLAAIEGTHAKEDKNRAASPINSINGDAELATAQSYLYGVNGPKDTKEAAKWLWKAVGKQNRTALLLLADLYQHGDGVAKSCDQAQLLLVAAAKKGLPEAGERLRYLQSAGCN